MTETGQTCDVCGEPLPEGAYFCGECGSRVTFLGADSRHSASPATPRSEPLRESPVAPPAESGADVPEIPNVDPSPPPPVSAEIPLAAPPHQMPGEAPGRPVYMLVFSTGERAQILGYGRIGRNPTPTEHETVDHLIVVNDDSRTVSKNHVDVWATDSGLELVDLGSANGTVVSIAGIAAERLVPGQRTVVMRGTRVALGDQSFTVE